MTDVELANSRPIEKSESQLRVTWRAFRRHRTGMIGLVAFSLMVLGVIFVPIFFPYPFQGLNHNAEVWYAPMGAVDKLTGHIFLLGSDKYGRDNLALLFFGGRSLFDGGSHTYRHKSYNWLGDWRFGGLLWGLDRHFAYAHNRLYAGLAPLARLSARAQGHSPQRFHR